LLCLIYFLDYILIYKTHKDIKIYNNSKFKFIKFNIGKYIFVYFSILFCVCNQFFQLFICELFPKIYTSNGLNIYQTVFIIIILR